ncbi:alpha/beta hydrolase [Jeotgalibacillus sp. R-1-5s-1]|uniref:alpha/beta hydrolase n=1 Tax=Jeotgalibacillus sp. R-1-5s-1 TaxID=2555897 RepID=UPI00106CDFEC|nr:DUF3089 domain-containing protein [Jeotgalibacillus sp. R-1-5s-1]TFD94337.1 DUF3089 domain-containing protein [Jeotgalibacillus sp. R-1-5s-1]
MKETKFVELQKELFSLFELEKYDDIHLLIDQAQGGFPDRLDKTTFWRACAYAAQENEKNAIAALEDGLNQGVWWNPLVLTYDRHLKTLKDIAAFKVILEECQKILENHIHISKPELFTYGHDQSDTGLFSLHMRGSNVETFAPYWFDDRLLDDLLLAFPQSSQVFGYNAYCWDNPSIAVNEITESYKDFKENFNTKQDIIAGASQGGKLAIELSLKGNTLGTKGFIAVIPAIQDVAALEGLLKGNTHDLKGCIITGDQDPFYNKTIEFVKFLEDNQFPCKLIVKEGLGHFFPDDFTELLREAVEFVRIS